MTPREEFRAALEQFEDAIIQLALLAQCFRRLEQELWPEVPLEPAEDLRDEQQA